MPLSEKVIELIKENNLKYFKAGDVCSVLGSHDGFSVVQITKILDDLVELGELIKTNKKKYVLPGDAGLIKGKIQSSNRGFAFLIPEDKEMEDLFIAGRNLNGAFDKDIVWVEKIPGLKRNSEEAVVVKIITRGIEEVVGKFQKNGKFGFVIPDSKNFSSDIYISDKNCKNVRNGDKVVCKITKYPDEKRSPEGKIIEVLGDSNTARIDFISLIRAYGFKMDFDEKVIKESETVPTSVSSSDKECRRDFTNIVTVTIDGDDAKDFDDAISIEKKPNGNYMLGVHIADVSHYVSNGSEIEFEAFKRATSVYFPSLVLPMLPTALSNGICSLNENVERLTLSAIMEVDSNGKVLSSEIVEGVIKSSKRLTYNLVNAYFNGDKQAEKQLGSLTNELDIMHELWVILDNQREKRGSIDFEIKESKIIVDENDNVVRVEHYKREDSNRMIEEFMILANRTVAEFVFFQDLPFVYRVHDKPIEEKLKTFIGFLASFGIKLKTSVEEVHPKQFSQLLERIENETYATVVNKVLLRSMQKAQYSSTDIGHFGLALTHYCHFTSPIRRYADLTVHRILKKIIKGEFDEKVLNYYNGVIDGICENCSKKSRNADEVEREVDDFYKAKYMLDKIDEKFEGIISGVTEFGIFVELESTVEGLIKLENLPSDSYTYFENKFMLAGRENKFRLGDKVNIIVKKVDLANRRVEFAFDLGE